MGYIRNRREPKMFPCGTPELTRNRLGICLIKCLYFTSYRATVIRRMVDGLTLPVALSESADAVPCSQLTPLMSSDHKLGGAYKPLMNRPRGSMFSTPFLE